MKRPSKKNLLRDKTEPFIYLWVNVIERKWYLGSRTAVGCHQDDGYICSSVDVKSMILSAPHEWRRIILESGGIPKDVRERENYLLKLLNARRDPMSYNKTNGEDTFNTEGLVCINDGIFQRYVPPERVEEYLKNGWSKGLARATRTRIGKGMSAARKENPSHWPVRKGVANNKSAEWLLISPTNEIYHMIGSLSEACKTLNLSYATISVACRMGWIPNKGQCAGWRIYNLTTMKGTVDTPQNFGKARSGVNNPSHQAKLKRLSTTSE
jgi:hypothetical protein